MTWLNLLVWMVVMPPAWARQFNLIAEKTALSHRMP